ncbi:sulfite exporter TauE/SafE family protein [Thiohalorhabdus sp. Cl-TMA]|uniref:Probable membrane transporter protein n=1 Tax=Thiohalorhabdus methylotrophus TaxID=3242694 RepID=A0ABV4TVR1_9GAMM
MGAFNQVTTTGALDGDAAFLLVLTSFILSTLIAIIAVIAGVGGGVLFTPIMLAFTTIDTLIIRSTGLVVAMFSGLVSSGPFMRKGLADVKIVFYCAIPIILGGMLGSYAAIALSEIMGAEGDAIVRLLLGVILVFIAILFIVGGSKTEYPEVKKVSPFSAWLNLQGSYYEESLGRVVHYQSTRAGIGGLLFLLVGFTGGFFGLGGGWAVVPVLNLVMTTPLKISAAGSGVLLAMGNSAAIWPYITYGALIAALAAPWMLGQVIGGIMGAHILARVKATFIRYILIFLLFFTSIKLIARGAESLLGIEIPIL